MAVGLSSTVEELVKEINKKAESDAIPDVSGLMPKSGGTFTGEVKFGSTENFQGYYIKRMLGSLGIGTRYENLDSKYKDGTYHRMWRLRFPSGSSFWGKIKVTLYGDYSSFNASGVMSKSITCNFNTSNIYNNVGCYDGLGVNVEQDFRISEAIWNATANAWEVLIWQQHLSGNNPAVIMLECWTKNNTNYINAFNGIAAQTVELTQSTSYSAQKASPTGGTKTVEWATLPVYENPLGEEIATASDIPTKTSQLTNDSGYTTNKGTVTQVKINGTTKSPDSAGLVDLGTVGGGGGSSDNSKHGYTELTNEDLNTITEVGWYRAANGNSCTNRPTTSTTAFILVVEKSTANYVRQTFYFVASTEEFYNRFSINGGSTWKTWITQTTLTNETQNISGYKSFLRGINVVNHLALNGESGSNGQFAMSRGNNKSATWVNIQVKVNGTTYTADNSGLIDLGTISGGGSASTSQYNDIY